MLPAPVEDTKASIILPDQTCQRLTLRQIKGATRNFDEAVVIGRGGFGKVYYSRTRFGLKSKVAIKRLHSTSSQGANEFEAEVKLLSKLRHGNLVPLIGYCIERNEKILAYEFMPNGTLEDHLHRGESKLSWLQRLKICTGAARGLDYLHTGTSTQHGVIQRDVKSSNILLDSNFAAKISDFGMAKVGTINQTRTHVSTLVKGTFGYLDPCYVYTGKLTRKSDVYSFGVVLLEVLCGKKAVDGTLDEDQWSLAVWAQDHIKGGRVQLIVESQLMGQISKKGLKEYTNIAVLCLHNQPKMRPTMAEVVVKLEFILSRERKNVGSGVDDGRFINKVRYFFTGKAELMPTAQAEESNSRNRSVKTFTYAELINATNNFNGELSTYSRDIIYEGWVDNLTYAWTNSSVGLPIYIRGRNIGASELDFKPEEYNHPNLAKLLGYCLHEKVLYFIFRQSFDPSLDKLLFRDPGAYSLRWVRRMQIAVGAAEGLHALHKKGHSAYRQLTTACILVDKDYNARLWDFEVTNSYLSFEEDSCDMFSYYAAPELFRYQADVVLEGVKNGISFGNGFGVDCEIYSFGVVLLEILTGMEVFDNNRLEGKQNLVKWATPLLADEANLEIILNPQLLDTNHPPKGAFMLAELVSTCLQPKPDQRPSMKKIVQVLHLCHREAVLTAKRQTI